MAGRTASTTASRHRIADRVGKQRWLTPMGAAGVLSTGIALLLTACSTLSPPPSRSLPIPTQFHHGATVSPAPAASVGSGADGGDPWLGLADPLAATLLTAAEQTAPSLQQALARVAEARAALAIVQADARPQVGATLQGSRGNSFGSSVSSGSTGASGTGTAGTGMSGAGTTGTGTSAGSLSQAPSNTLTGALTLSWEIDLFGRLAAGRLAAQARLQAADADARLARVTLRSAVLDTLVSARACRLEEASQQASLASASATRALTVIKVNAGLAPPMDRSRTEAAEGEARANLVAIEGNCAAFEQTLASLVGRPEEDIHQQLMPAVQAPVPAVPATPPWQAQLPAEVLARHPQIHALQRQADAAWADLGQARTGHLPSLNLGAVLSSTLVQVSAGHAILNSWSLGPNLAATLFDGGRIDGTIDQAQARYREAVLALTAGVRDTVRDIELALIQGETAERAKAQASDTLRASQALFDASDRAQRAGRLSLFELENARAGLLSAQLALVHAERDRARAWVALMKATGSPAPVATLPAEPLSLSPPFVGVV